MNKYRHGDLSNNEVLSSGTKLIDTNNIEYRKLTVLSGQVQSTFWRSSSSSTVKIDPDQLNAPKTMKERVQQTCRFLDSLKSLMEQEVMEHDLIKCKFLIIF